MKRIWLIRHGESESNAGLPTQSPTTTRITERGQRQADKLAASWWIYEGHEPGLVATSPYVRTKLTAEPFLRRYPKARQVEWPIHEFTQLDPKHWAGSTHADRLPKVREYWERFEPEARDGDGADSFRGFLGRVYASICMAAESTEEHVAIFTHGHCVHAAIWLLLFSGSLVPTSDDMRRFYTFTQAVEVVNTAVLPITYVGGAYHVGRLRTPTEA